jgi:hypothetical protein
MHQSLNTLHTEVAMLKSTMNCAKTDTLSETFENRLAAMEETINSKFLEMTKMVSEASKYAIDADKKREKEIVAIKNDFSDCIKLKDKTFNVLETQLASQEAKFNKLDEVFAALQQCPPVAPEEVAPPIVVDMVKDTLTPVSEETQEEIVKEEIVGMPAAHVTKRGRPKQKK